MTSLRYTAQGVLTNFTLFSVGDLRLRLPHLVTAYNGTVNATSFGCQCIQQRATISVDLPVEVLESLAPFATASSPDLDVPQSEDCE